MSNVFAKYNNSQVPSTMLNFGEFILNNNKQQQGNTNTNTTNTSMGVAVHLEFFLDTSTIVAMCSACTNNYAAILSSSPSSLQSFNNNVFLQNQLQLEAQNAAKGEALLPHFTTLLAWNDNYNNQVLNNNEAQQQPIGITCKLYIARAALDEVNVIIQGFAGPLERQRAEQLLSRLVIVEQQQVAPSTRVMALKESKRVKASDKLVFGIADAMHIPIITADAGFVTAASAQGVLLNALVHPSRSLVGI